eukprot:PhM_4_TR10053/c1_g1_i1/m.42386
MSSPSVSQAAAAQLTEERMAALESMVHSLRREVDSLRSDKQMLISENDALKERLSDSRDCVDDLRRALSEQKENLVKKNPPRSTRSPSPTSGSFRSSLSSSMAAAWRRFVGLLRDDFTESELLMVCRETLVELCELAHTKKAKPRLSSAESEKETRLVLQYHAKHRIQADEEEANKNEFRRSPSASSSMSSSTIRRAQHPKDFAVDPIARGPHFSHRPSRSHNVIGGTAKLRSTSSPSVRIVSGHGATVMSTPSSKPIVSRSTTPTHTNNNNTPYAVSDGKNDVDVVSSGRRTSYEPSRESKLGVIASPTNKTSSSSSSSVPYNDRGCPVQRKTKVVTTLTPSPANAPNQSVRVRGAGIDNKMMDTISSATTPPTSPRLGGVRSSSTPKGHLGRSPGVFDCACPSGSLMCTGTMKKTTSEATNTTTTTRKNPNARARAYMNMVAPRKQQD